MEDMWRSREKPVPLDFDKILKGTFELRGEKVGKPAKGKGKAKEVVIDTSTFLPRVSSPWKVGAHVSAAGGVENAVANAAAIG